jgi:hypothetical protein
MFIRRFQRGISVVAIAACAPMVFGCASTNRFVVDPGIASSLVVEAVVISVKEDSRDEITTRFDAAGGKVDLGTKTIVGTSENSEPVSVPLAKVKRFYFQDGSTANLAAWIDGAGWRPDGKVQYVALQSGEVMDVRKIPTTVDAERRVVQCAPAHGVATAIPFDQIVDLQIRETHLGRTAGRVVVGVLLLTIGVGLVAISRFSSGSF